MATSTPIHWIVLGLLTVLGARAQQTTDDQEIRTRQLWDTNLLTKRPPGKKPQPKPTAKLDDNLVGMTLWRLRPSKPTDAPSVRALIHEEDATREWTPERVSADTPIREGESVRISIETARTGYLYVIDREEYADHSKNDPNLIFPTLRLREGNNHVMAGTVIEIPSAEDTPPFYKMKRGRADQTNELLTIIVSPEPISGLQITRETLRLSAAQVADWEKRWTSVVHRLEASGQAGQPYTMAEKKAGAREGQLTADDPLPQTMYRVDCKPGATVLLQLPVKIAK
jgi:hypothetical protein